MTNKMELVDFFYMDYELRKLRPEEVNAFYQSNPIVMENLSQSQRDSFEYEINTTRMIDFVVEHKVFFDIMMDGPEYKGFKKILRFILADFRHSARDTELPVDKALEIISEIKPLLFYGTGKDNSTFLYEAYSVPEFNRKVNEYWQFL